MKCEKRTAVVPGATHSFEERGALDELAILVGDWFLRHFDHVSDGLSQRAVVGKS